MGNITTHNRQNTLFFHSESSLGKQSLAYLKSSDFDIRIIDISETKVTGTQWAEIAEKLNMNLSDLVAKDHPDFKSNYDTSTKLSSDDWIKVLQKHPKVLCCPVLINGENYHLIQTPSKIAKILEGEESAQDARSLD